MKALIARKIGMTSVIDEHGATKAVTLLKATPNTITQVKTLEIDGYEAVQLGFEESKKSSKAKPGEAKPGRSAKVIKEFRLSQPETDLAVGSQIDVESFQIGDQVDVTGINKGKGFAGTIKRHNFHRGPKTHGGASYRRPGSIGSMFPQNIKPGKKMAGHMGNHRTTIKHLKIALVDKELNVIGVSGAVPGPRRGIVLLKEAK